MRKRSRLQAGAALMVPDDEEDAHAHLLRLLCDNAEHDHVLLESSRRALDESRRLLEKVARDHPDIE